MVTMQASGSSLRGGCPAGLDWESGTVPLPSHSSAWAWQVCVCVLVHVRPLCGGGVPKSTCPDPHSGLLRPQCQAVEFHIDSA